MVSDKAIDMDKTMPFDSRPYIHDPLACKYN